MQFLTWRALPLLVSPVALIERVWCGEAVPDMVGGTITLAAAITVLVAGPIAVAQPARRGDRRAQPVAVAWGAYAAIYTVAVLLWLANLLELLVLSCAVCAYVAWCMTRSVHGWVGA